VSVAIVDFSHPPMLSCRAAIGARFARVAGAFVDAKLFPIIVIVTLGRVFPVLSVTVKTAPETIAVY
jgi:hypothetical protein